jgi:hypothetical protein
MERVPTDFPCATAKQRVFRCKDETRSITVAPHVRETPRMQSAGGQRQSNGSAAD